MKKYSWSLINIGRHWAGPLRRGVFSGNTVGPSYPRVSHPWIQPSADWEPASPPQIIQCSQLRLSIGVGWIRGCKELTVKSKCYMWIFDCTPNPHCPGVECLYLLWRGKEKLQNSTCNPISYFKSGKCVNVIAFYFTKIILIYINKYRWALGGKLLSISLPGFWRL